MQKFKYLNILFIGDLNEGARSLMRAEILKEVAGSVKCLTNTPIPFIAGVNKPAFYTRVLNKLRIPRDEVGINEALIKIAKSDHTFDVAWIEKSTMLRPSVLKYFKKKSINTKIISLSEDDMFAYHNRSRYYEKSLNYYDTVFTTKLYNLDELKLLGANDTELFLDSYNSELHRPLKKYNVIKDKEIDISFIGSYEGDRANIIMWLGSMGFKVIVYGNGWSSLVNKNKNINIMDSAILSEEYVKTINNSKINLGFLRKINRDEVTSRSMEITGCGSFLLAERTSRHSELFKEGYEAEFFDSKEELKKKIEHYLKNFDEIEEISKNARIRCLKDGYSMKSQIENILKYLYKSKFLSI